MSASFGGLLRIGAGRLVSLLLLDVLLVGCGVDRASGQVMPSFDFGAGARVVLRWEPDVGSPRDSGGKVVLDSGRDAYFVSAACIGGGEMEVQVHGQDNNAVVVSQRCDGRSSGLTGFEAVGAGPFTVTRQESGVVSDWAIYVVAAPRATSRANG